MNEENGKPRTYILIDYENIHPDAIAMQLLKMNKLKILIFAKRKDRLSFDRAKILQPLGRKVEYILTKATGANALDFHIACYIGVLLQKAPGSQVYIISNDSGFDSLISTVNESERLKVKRCGSFANIPGLKLKYTKEMEMEIENTPEVPRLAAFESCINKARNSLHKSGNARPRTITTLTRSLDAMFNHEMTDQEIQEILAEMQRDGFVNVADDGKVSYIFNQQVQSA
jgi:hypothetical protein